jgi:hypothetical protein
MRARLISISVTIILWTTLAIPQFTDRSARLTRYQNSQGHYSALVPKKWHHYENGAVALLTNFVPPESVGDDTLPTGGASIRIVPMSIFNNPLTPDRWLDNLTRTCLGGSTRVERVDPPHSRDLTDVTRVSCDLSAPLSQPQRLVGYLFSSDGRVFNILLRYVKGDPNGEGLEETQKRVVETFRRDQ